MATIKRNRFAEALFGVPSGTCTEEQSLNIKRTVIACAAAAGIAGLAFGGSAVATQFTSTSNTQYAEAQGASTGVVVSGGTFKATGLVPGADPVLESTLDIHNSGVDGIVTITFGAFTVITPGTGGSPDPSKLLFSGFAPGPVTLSAFAVAGNTYTLGALASGHDVTYPISVALQGGPTGAGNDWNGADAYVPYTVTITAGT